MAPTLVTESQFQVTLARRTTRPSSWAPFGRLAERVVSALPTHRDTRSGRRNAQQIRAVMLAAGILIVVLWDSPWAPLALIGCLSALVIPVSESKRRHWGASLRVSRTVPVLERLPAVLSIEPKHVTLTAAGERIRRLRRNVLQVSHDDGRLELRSGAKKSERLLITASEPVSEDLWVDAPVADVIAALG